MEEAREGGRQGPGSALKQHLTVATLVLIGLVWHAFGVAGAWPRVATHESGRDFASYYYAARASLEGLDPYTKKNLGALAREEGTRKGVHPFLYPPPFLLVAAPFTPLTLGSAYRQWFWFSEGTALAAMLVLAVWLRRLHFSAPAVLFLLLAAVTAVPNNLVMGQANFPVLLLLSGALLADQRDRQGIAGVLLGTACMLKMSPALFVLWWMLHRRWTGVLSAIGTAIGLSLLTLPLLGLQLQLGFYTEVLPQFASGRYNGLSIPIDLFGNHSVPNLLNEAFPGARGELSSTARWLARGLTLTLIATTGLAFRQRGDAWQSAAQASAITVLMLLLPVYTYEHHLVWALPAAGFLCIAVLSRRVHWVLGIPLALALLAYGWNLAHLKGAFPMLREAKFAALVFFYGSCVWLGYTGITSPQLPASPAPSP